MKKNSLKKYVMLVAGFLLQSHGSTIQAETWVALPYPDNIKDLLKDENKKIDLDDDPLFLGSLNELFDSARTDAIIVAAFITKKEDNFFVSYTNPLSYLHDFFKNVPGNKKGLITEKTYDQLKRTYKKQNPDYVTSEHDFTTHILQQGQKFTTSDEDDLRPFYAKPPYFVDGFNGLIIQNVYFFKIIRTKKNDTYDYKAEYIGNLDNIVTSASKIADLVRELINNFEGDNNAKKDELKRIIQEYKNAQENDIANSLLGSQTTTLEEKKERLQEAIDEILNDTEFFQFQLPHIKKVFDEQIKPLGIKIPLEMFKEIIEKKSLVFAPSPHITWQLMQDYSPYIEEYQDKKDEILKTLHDQFVSIILTLFPRLTRDAKSDFIQNLKKINTTNESLKDIITDVINDYIYEEEKRIKTALLNIKNAQSGAAAEKIFKDENIAEKASSISSPAAEDVIKIYINKDNDPFAAFLFLLGETNYNGQERATNKLVNQAKERLLVLTPQEEAIFVRQFKKIGEKMPLFKNTIETAIKDLKNNRELQAKALVNFAQALNSI